MIYHHLGRRYCGVERYELPGNTKYLVNDVTDWWRTLTEAPAAACGLLDHDAGADNVAELREEPEQGVVGHGVGDVEHEQVAPVRAFSRDMQQYISIGTQKEAREKSWDDNENG